MNYSSSFNNLYKIIQQSTSQEKDNKVDDKKKIGYLSSRIIKIVSEFILFIYINYLLNNINNLL